MTATFEPATPEPTALDASAEPPAPGPVRLESIQDIDRLPGVIDRKNPLGHYAGFVTRLVAFLIDQAIVLVILFITGVMARLLQDTLPLGPATQALLTVAVLAAGFLFYVLYFILFWVLAGQTPGKKFMGVRIVGIDGERIHPRQAVVRLIGYLISLFLFLGYLWALVDTRRQGWHDHLARTFVVYSWPEMTKAQRAAMKTERNRQRQDSLRRSADETESSANPVVSPDM